MGNKLFYIVVGVIVIVGVVIGLGVSGIVNIPGLTHVKKASKKSKSAKQDDAAKQDPAAADPAKPAAAGKPKGDSKTPDPAAGAPNDLAAKKPEEPKPDLEKGYSKLAAVWAEMDPEKIKLVLKADYKPESAAPILKKMDEDKVAAVLTGMDPKEAAAYMEALGKEASKPPPDAPPSP